MTTMRRKLVVSGAALVLALALGSCGGTVAPEETPAEDTTLEQTEETTDVEESEGTEEPEPASAPVLPSTHDALVDPAAINPGWQDSDNTSDLWWPNGDQSAAESLYFTNAANDAGMDATFVDAEGSESNVWNLEVVDGHLQTQADAEDKRKVDITFQDDFTCYDAVTGTFYLRGDRSEAAYQELVAGKMYVYDLDDPEYMRLTFQEDGTAEQSQKGDAIEGTWKVCTPNVVVCHYAVDGSEWDSEYRFVYDEENNIAELYSGSPNTLKLFVE